MSATDIRRRFVPIWVPMACVVLLTSMPDAVTARQQTDPRSQVTAAVRDAIRLLEANQHLDFIKKYMRPSELEPAFDSDGTRARYSFPAPIGGESALTLQKIGDRWYIRD
jgi:hypothetical protein